MEIDLAELASQPEWKQILVNIVTKEKMDPWDIDISGIANSFMDRLKKMKKLDFRIPANAILASSILLRFKSDSWILEEEAEDLEPIYIPDDIISEPIIPELEPVIRITKRRVSLEELIQAVEDMMKKEKKKEGRRRERINIIPQALVDVIEENGENFERRLDEIYSKIQKKADKENLLLFSDLIDKKTVDDVITNFVPLLHLANSQKVDIWQEKYFGEIFIHLLENGLGGEGK